MLSIPHYESNFKPEKIIVCYNSAFDRDTLLGRLQSRLPGIHRAGADLVAPCPKCATEGRHDKHGNLGGLERFFARPKYGYRYFHCRQCGHSIPTATLLGLGWTEQVTPAVKPWTEPVQQPGRIKEIRELYKSLAEFAQSQLPHTPHAIQYLADRGLLPAERAHLSLVRRAGLGYIDAPLYRQWYSNLAADQRTVCEWAGLPRGDRDRLSGHGAMFAGGYQGKIVFPYYDDAGDGIDIRTRSISPKDTILGKAIRYTSPKGGMNEREVNVPYGVHLLAPGPVVLTEGEFKALASTLLAGVPCLGLRGTSDWHDNYLEHLRGRLVILAFDNDPNGAGSLATVQIGRLLQAHRIDAVILDPTHLGAAKGIDDYIVANGGRAFAALVKPANLLTLSEYERKLEGAGIDLSKLKRPRGDVGTVRQWRPESHVDNRPHAETPTITVDEAVAQIDSAVRDHLRSYRRGHEQLLITAPAGVGKTQTTIEVATAWAVTNDQTVAVILPNHATIDEKIADVTLAGFTHIYGHNADNCQQSESATALTRKGYSPGQVLCPDCPFADECKRTGYKSQFVGRENRAYVTAHVFSDYPDGEDIVIADELTHKAFVGSMNITLNDLASASEQGGMPQAQRDLLAGFMQMWTAPGLSDIAGLTFYTVLERFFPGLRDVDAWGDGSSVQGALFDAATAFVNGADVRAEDLPQQFGLKLINLLSEDVRRLNAGQPVTGRVRFVSLTSRAKWLELTYSRGHLPTWYSRRPTIILNATAEADVMQDIAGPLSVLAPQVAVADGNQIVQDVTFNNAKSSYLGNSEQADKRRAAWLAGIRIHIAQHPGGEADTTIIVAKALAGHVEAAFPAAKVAHYHALEGRNDLQRGLTILASAVPVDISAVIREASALYPGVDTTLTRSTSAFEDMNAGGELVAIEQIDAVDARVSALIAQHRDAAAVQAVHRSRIVRQTGRKVVVMFSRPIPGLRPSNTVTDRPTGEDKRTAQKAAILDRLMSVASALVSEMGGFAADLLASGASASVNTAKKYLPDICKALALSRFTLPALQTLANGATVKREIALVVTPEIVSNIRETTRLYVDQHSNYKDKITSVIHVHLSKFLPTTWAIDIDTLLATLTPSPVERESAPAELPGRWNAAADPQALKEELLRAKQGSPEKQRAANRLIAYLDAKHNDITLARGAAYEIGIPYAVRWAVTA